MVPYLVVMLRISKKFVWFNKILQNLKYYSINKSIKAPKRNILFLKVKLLNRNLMIFRKKKCWCVMKMLMNRLYVIMINIQCRNNFNLPVYIKTTILWIIKLLTAQI